MGRWRHWASGLAAAAGIIALTVGLEALFRRQPDAWASAVQSALTIVLAGATVAYVFLTHRLVGEQARQLREARRERERQALAASVRVLRTEVWNELNRVQALFPVSRIRPLDVERYGYDALQALVDLQKRLWGDTASLPPPAAAQLMELVFDFSDFSYNVTLLRDAVYEATQVSSQSPEQAGAGQDSGATVQFPDDWDIVKAAYYTNVRNPEATNPIHPEWDELINGARLDHICRKVMHVATVFEGRIHADAGYGDLT